MKGLLFRPREPLWQKVLLAPLSPLAGAFGAVASLRRALYRSGVLATARAPIPVLSVGNLVAGGAGKTPVVLELAERLLARGARVAVLSRGYGGSGAGARIVSRGDGGAVLLDAADAGDEPVLLARRCPRLAVLVGPSRAELARLAAAALGARVAVLDDGFQHLALARDADIVVLDGAAPFGNGRLLPRGPLREAPGALGRAQLAWIAKADEGEPALVDEAAARARELTGAEVVRSRYRLAAVIGPDLAAELPGGPGALAGRRVFLLAGLARPASFETTVTRAGATIVGRAFFPDHHAFDPAELDGVARRAEVAGAEALLCTEKDAVRLSPRPAGSMPLWVARVATELVAGGAALDALLDRILAAAGPVASPRPGAVRG